MNRFFVRNGIDRIGDVKEKLKEKHVGLLTNASGVDKSGVPSYLRLSECASLDVLFAPEHGIRSSAQDGKYGVELREPETGAAICNLNARDYGEAERYLRQIDLLCYDIQDVGARFYTYLWSLYDLMKLCGRIGIPVLIFDRPNPIGGEKVEGEILQTQYASFIGRTAIPTRYALTVGELMTYLNLRDSLGCEIEVVEVAGWNRSMYYDETDLLFVNPSPNIPSVGSAFNYIGNCIWEATNLSEGRGTTRPFDLIGAPFVRSDELTELMRSLNLPGVIFRRASFIPQFQKYAGETCEGIELHITDRDAYEPIRTMLHLWKYFRTYPEFSVKEAGVCLRFGSDRLLYDFDIPELLEEFRVQNLAFWRDTEKIRRY